MATSNALVLVGGGGHCRSCIDVVEATGDWRIAAILDVPDHVDERVLGYAIAGTDAEIDRYAADGAAFLVTVGQIKSTDRRVMLYEKIRAAGGRLPTIVSPHAYVSRHGTLGEGTIVMHRAVVNAGAIVGDNVIINTMALVEHDARVGNHCHVSTAAIVNGEAIIGARSFVGSNAIVHQRARVSEGAVVPAGAVFRAVG
jgi:sugar O-acyltransferase (sialic acid O-acetyltransferase NeuD family)